MAIGGDADGERPRGRGELDPPRDACYARGGNELDAIEIVTRPKRCGRITRSSLRAGERRQGKEERQLSYAFSILGTCRSVIPATREPRLGCSGRSDRCWLRTRACTPPYRLAAPCRSARDTSRSRGPCRRS